MPGDGSVTRWLEQLPGGDPRAVQQLWERYFGRLVRLARKRLQNAPRRMADEEDVALSAFESLCRNAGRGRFPQLTDRDNLWRLLVVLTARKAARVVRYHRRHKRGGDLPSARETAPPERTLRGGKEPSIEEILSREPSPAFAAQMAEDYERLLCRLGDKKLAGVAVWRMEGYTVEEIAERLGCAPRSVKRKLQLIRTLWESESMP